MPKHKYCEPLRDLVYIPIGLIKEAHSKEWFRSLAYFVRLKSCYKNNTHYNFSLRSLSDKIKCSPACLATHLKVLHKEGLISYHSNNITFLGLKKLQSKYGQNNIAVPVNHKNQNDLLRGQIIRFNLNAQQHRIKKSGIQLRKGGFIPHTKYEKMNSSYVGLSASGLGLLFGLSSASGSRIRNRLKNLRQFSINRVYTKLFDNVSVIDYLNMLKTGIIPSYSLHRDGNILIEKRPRMEYIGNVSSLH